jgi:hypothetical protein
MTLIFIAPISTRTLEIMLIEAIETFIPGWNQHATPLEWTKEEVQQQQIKYSYSNLCN